MNQMPATLLYHHQWGSTRGSHQLTLPEAPWRTRLRFYTAYATSRLQPAIPIPVHPTLRLTAQALLLAGAAGVMLTMLPVAAIELKYQANQLLNPPAPPTRSALPPTPTAVPGPRNEQEAFFIRVPKIGAESIVIPNVDATDPDRYMPALQRGVAHAAGTGLPATPSRLNRTIYLFAHSTSAPSLVTRYNAQFYLLHKLEPGDEIELTYWAQKYTYRVTDTRIVGAADTTVFEPQTDKEQLVLATCSPPGTTWKRLLVLAEPSP